MKKAAKRVSRKKVKKVAKKVHVTDKIREIDIRAIRALSERGNNVQMIAEVLRLKVKDVRYILQHIADYEPVVKRKSLKEMETEEQIADFTRILADKRGSAELGEKLWNNMAGMSDDYMHNFEADSYCKFNFGNRAIGLVAMSDFHIGHEGVAYEKLKQDFGVISSTPDMYMAFLGDAIDNFINDKHRGAMLNAVSSPKQQLYMLQYILKLLKKPDEKILFVVKDNHVSHRLKQATGIDWSNKMWADYNVFYGGEEVRAEITLGKSTYNLLGRHKFRGYSRIHLTAAPKKLIKEGPYGDIDVAMMAHRHEGAMELFDWQGSMRAAIQSSTYKLVDPFAASLGFHPSHIFMPVLIMLPGETKKFVIAQDVNTAADILKVINKKK